MNGFVTGRSPEPAQRDAPARRTTAGLIVSTALHAALLLALVPMWLEDMPSLSTAGGSGWADEVDLKASRDVSDGAQGEGKSEHPATHVLRGDRPDKLEVQVVYLAKQPPKLPEPEVDLNLPPLPPRVSFETDIAELVEKPREPVQQEPERLSNTEHPSDAASAGDVGSARQADVNDAGGSGSRDQPEGAQAGTAIAGAGSGNSDRLTRDGNYLRGNEILQILQGWTLVGTEGGWDGSTSDNNQTRHTFRWQAYYAPDGTVEVRFETWAAKVAHGSISMRQYADSGSWTIQGDLLCQKIADVGYGVPVCFEVHHKDGNRVAMYYAECGGLHRCYRGRLGPEGVILPGRQFTM